MREKKNDEKNNCFFLAAFLVYVARARALARTNIIAQTFFRREKKLFSLGLCWAEEWILPPPTSSMSRMFWYATIYSPVFCFIFLLLFSLQKPSKNRLSNVNLLRRMKIDRIVAGVRWATHRNRQSSANITDRKLFLLNISLTFFLFIGIIRMQRKGHRESRWRTMRISVYLLCVIYRTLILYCWPTLFIYPI